ncbi:hypothetical protein LTR02_002310 [Friedmanniomyces endolithicus]|nr:hypothetical protein LTR94_000325 [Friedmanniomyces endolithicus]KAK0820386.1 hypothetical protein LTR38_000295 [Friedmanniomyces endolithicus]KAK0884010.1 hypothetical protein LTR87_002231 [Friedmanniomyces endolithicus]KAK0913462.1 hypothetical protein LTR02_002310 [Friedmanniomyces endolithicus]KAK0923950.1 hypothetical protein LTR57_006326 [Friedmanniomyces endolithicus]
MADLYELLAPNFDLRDSSTITSSSSIPPPSANDPHTSSYLNRLATLSLPDLSSTEPASLLHAAQSHLRNLQALSKRSHRAVIASSTHLANLSTLLPLLGTQARHLRDQVPALETSASEFAQKYDRSTENAVLDRRKRALLLHRNVDRVADVLELPSLLSSTVVAAQAPTATGSASSTQTTSYASALDLHAHIKRLHTLYPQSELVGGISTQAEAEVQNLTSILIASLQNPSLKLAAAIRTVGWLRRVAPDLAEDGDTTNIKPAITSIRSLSLSSTTNAAADGAIGTLFLICRLRNLNNTLAALDPLRELADQESARRKRQTANGVSKPKQPATSQPLGSAIGSQSERYLKRYVEIFREQSFGVVIATFALHLVDMLTDTLREYTPNLSDKTARESLLTQVLYCAGSLGRLGADFGMMLAILEEELMMDDQSTDDDDDGVRDTEEDPEWVQVMKKHRVQASRLEVLARGVGSGSRKGSAMIEAGSPGALSGG